LTGIGMGALAFLSAAMTAAACSTQEQASPPDTSWIPAELRALYGDVPGEVRYFEGSTDLNGDGNPEVIVHVVGPMLCGTGGCNTLVYTPGDSGYDLVANIGLTRPPIRVSSRSTGGWRSLLVRVSGGGISPGYDAELRFEGGTYPANPTVAPVVPAADTAGAETVIQEFDQFTDGTLVPPPHGPQVAAVGAPLLGRWEWVSFQGMDDSFFETDDPSRYTLEIREDGVSVVADCNRGMGGVVIEASSVRFTELAVTRMACPPESLGERYLSYLRYVRGWVISNGDLYLSLFADGGIMRFRPGGDGP